MKKFLLVLAAIIMMATNAVAQTPSRVRVDASSVTGVAAGGAETARRAEAGVADLRALLSATQADLSAAQRDIRVAKGIGGAALARAEKVEAALAAKVAELEAKISSETIKVQGEVERAAIGATVKIVGIQHGVSVPPPPVDAVTQVTNPAVPSATAQTSTGLERIECPAGTALSRLRISVTDGSLRTGFRNEEKCLPIPGYISPDAPVVEKPRTMPLWAKYASFIAGGAAIGGAGTYAVNRFGDGAGGAGDVAGGAVLGAVGGAAFCALTELF